MGWQEANQYRWRCHHDERYFQRAAASRPISFKTKENAPYQSCKIADGKNCETLNEAADGIAWTKKNLADNASQITIIPNSYHSKRLATKPIFKRSRVVFMRIEHFQRLAPVAISLKNALGRARSLVTSSCQLAVSTLS